MGPVPSQEIKNDARGENEDGERSLPLVLPSGIDATTQRTTKSLMSRDGAAWFTKGDMW